MQIEVSKELIESLSACMEICASEGLLVNVENNLALKFVIELREKFNLPDEWWY